MDRKQEHEYWERVQNEIRSIRRTGLSAAIQEEGAQLMKGASAMPPRDRALIAIQDFLGRHLPDPEGTLREALMEFCRDRDILLVKHQDSPLEVLRLVILQCLSQEERLRECVRRADFLWGRRYDVRPHFERPGMPPHPDDPYTLVQVGDSLSRLLDDMTA